MGLRSLTTGAESPWAAVEHLATEAEPGSAGASSVEPGSAGASSVEPELPLPLFNPIIGVLAEFGPGLGPGQAGQCAGTEPAEDQDDDDEEEDEVEEDDDEEQDDNEEEGDDEEEDDDEEDDDEEGDAAVDDSKHNPAHSGCKEPITAWAEPTHPGERPGAGGPVVGVLVEPEDPLLCEEPVAPASARVAGPAVVLLAERGRCQFADKAREAARRGAAGMLVVNAGDEGEHDIWAMAGDDDPGAAVCTHGAVSVRRVPLLRHVRPGNQTSCFPQHPKSPLPLTRCNAMCVQRWTRCRCRPS